MNYKGQTIIITAVLLTAITLSVVTLTYIWGQPLIQKSTEQTNIDRIISKLDELNSAIEYVSDTGSPRTVRFQLGDETLQIRESENAVSYRLTTLIPIFSSIEWNPINSYENSIKKEIIGANTSKTSSFWTPFGASGDTHYSNITLEDQEYNITVYKVNNTVYNYACLWQTTINPQNCGFAGESLRAEGINYLVSWINESGEEVVLQGKETENIGLLGTDPAGIIAGRTIAIGENERIVRIRLSYRGLIDNSGVIQRIKLNCDRSCLTGQGMHTLRIERSNINITSNETNINLNLWFEN